MENENVLKSNKMKYVILAIITVVFLAVDQSLVSEEVLSEGNMLWIILSSFKGDNIAYIALCPILIIFYRYVGEITKKYDFREKMCAVIPATIFSFFMVFGYSFYVADNLELVTNVESGQPIKAIFLIIGYSILFYFLVLVAYYYFDLYPFVNSNCIDSYSSKFWIIEKYRNLLKNRTFCTVFFTLLLFYFPYIIVSYPAIFFEDAHTQIIQAYQELGYVEPMYLKHHLLSEEVLLNNHHPIVHTLWLHLFIQFGNKVFHSINVGVFLFALLQLILLLVTISYTAKILIQKYQVKEIYILLMILYYAISPRIQNYMFVVTKDIYYSIFVLLFINFCSAILDEQSGKQAHIGFAVSAIGMLLFRNEGKYVIIATCFLMAILYRKIWKKMTGYILFFVLFSFIFSQFLFAFKITPGGKREMLSVPLQQTARYVRDYADEVTEEEREAISDVVHYSKLGEDYNPDVSDSAKWTFRDYATKEELTAYAEAWLSMFKKHPGVYIQATMNNYYAYFYSKGQPFEGCTYQLSQECMDIMNNKLLPLEIAFSYPEGLEEVRNAYEKYREEFSKIPIVSLLMMPETYTWLMIVLLFYTIKHKNQKALALQVMPIVILMVCLVGPCNGYYCRYLYPIMICLPAIIPRINYFIMKNNSGLEEK